jgi:transposase, IS30 family
MHYHHLTLEQRSQIEALQSMGASQKGIARQLNLSPSTISRELARHGVKGVGYVGLAAQRQAEATRYQARALSHSIAPELVYQVEDCIRQDWSPEQISGYLKKMGDSVSHQWIYEHVWVDRKSGGTLYTHLRHRGKKYNRRGSKKAGRGCIPNRIDIKERPPIVEEKSRLGDWEIDTIIGARQQGAILSIVDRKSKFTLLALLPDKTAASVTAGVRQCFERLKQMNPNAPIHSITADNGKEFSEHLTFLNVKERSEGQRGERTAGSVASMSIPMAWSDSTSLKRPPS